MLRTFKYRAKPTQEQTETAMRWLRLTRIMYNAALQHREGAWERAQFFGKGTPERKARSVTQGAQTAEFTQIRKEDSEIAEVPYTVMRDTVFLRADRAYQAFFKAIGRKGVQRGGGKAKTKKGADAKFVGSVSKPKFKAPKFWNSLRTEQPTDIKVVGNTVRFPKMGFVRFVMHRPVLGKPVTLTLTKELNQWYVSIGCRGVPAREFPKRTGSLSAHLGIRKFLHFGDERAVPNAKPLIRSEEKLARLQRVLSRRKKGSNRWRKQKFLVAKLHRKIVRQRDHYLHKWSYRLVCRYSLIGIEDWAIREMIEKDKSEQYRELRKRIADVSWYKFRQMLKYKAEEAERNLVEINGAATTQTCSNCGHVKDPPIPLSVLIFECERCGLKLDREENAVRNLRAAVDKRIAESGNHT